MGDSPDQNVSVKVYRACRVVHLDTPLQGPSHKEMLQDTLPLPWELARPLGITALHPLFTSRGKLDLPPERCSGEEYANQEKATQAAKGQDVGQTKSPVVHRTVFNQLFES